MATTAGDVLTRLKEKLNDLGSVRWPDAEHFRGMNDAQQAILEARPDLFEVYSYVDTVAGSAQTVPADCYRLFDVVYNCDNSNSPVSVVTRVSREKMDRHRRHWPLMTSSSTALHWMQDEREWNRFYLVPGQPTTGRGKLLLRYAKRPSTITSSASVLAVPDEGINAVYNFCMHRALEKDEKFAGSPTASAYMQKFAQFIAAKAEFDQQFAQQRESNEMS